jgi:hypothetical protein
MLVDATLHAIADVGSIPTVSTFGTKLVHRAISSQARVVAHRTPIGAARPSPSAPVQKFRTAVSRLKVQPPTGAATRHGRRAVPAIPLVVLSARNNAGKMS